MGRRITLSTTVVLALLAAVPNSAPRAQEGDNEAAGAAEKRVEEGDAPSVAQPCLNHPTIRRTKVLNDRNIVFVTRDNTIYNNQLPRQCPSLKRNSLVNYPIVNSRLCAGSSFTVLWEVGINNFVPAFVCALGIFVPITESELEDLTTMTAETKAERSGRRRSRREAVTTEQVELPPADAAPTE